MPKGVGYGNAKKASKKKPMNTKTTRTDQFKARKKKKGKM